MRRDQAKPEIQERSRNSDTSQQFLRNPGTKGWNQNQWEKEKRGSGCFETTFGMVIARTALVAAAPPRPGQDQDGAPRQGPDEPREQTAYFRNRQSKRSRSRGGRRSSGETLRCTNSDQI